MKRTTFLLIIMLMLTTCCNEVSQHERVLSDIDSLLLQPGLTTAGADSARQMLLHMSQEMEGADEDTRAYYHLLRVKADERAKKKHVSDSLICTVVQHFEQHDPSGHLPEAYYVAGCVNSYLQNGDFTLAMDRSNEILDGLFEEGAEQITGYVAASPKTGSSQLITSDKDDPILTVWQYGMGKTVAWNSDVSGVWSGKLFSQEDTVAMWKRICEYSFGYRTDTGDRLEYVEADTEGGEKRIRYTTNQANAATTIEGVVTGPDKERKELVLAAKSPGVYEAPLPEGEEGVYYLSVLRKENGEILSTVQSAAIRQFSDEYRFEISDKQVKDFVERIGRSLSFEQSVWKGENRLKSSSRSLTIPLLITALFLFLFQIAHRRLEFGVLWAEKRSAEKRQKQKAGNAGGNLQNELLQKEREQEKAKEGAGREGEAGLGADPYAALAQSRRREEPQTAQGIFKRGNDSAMPVNASEQNKAAGGANAGSGLNTSLLLQKKKDRNGG